MKIDKNLLRVEYGKIWKTDTKMVDYCVNKAASMAILPDNSIIVIDKRNIETRFCFGESGYDYDDAFKMAQHARTNEDYFRQENMSFYNRFINDIRESLRRTGNYCLVISARGSYINQPSDCRLNSCSFVRWVDIIEVCGGECRISELPGKVVTVRGVQCRIATKEEHERIMSAYVEAANAHGRKVDAYLKRYGLTKVHSWTYWRDA